MPVEAVADRRAAGAAALFDMGHKYADVLPERDVLTALARSRSESDFFGVALGTDVLERSGAPPRSCLLGRLCQETLGGTHSVANIENSRLAPVAPQLGQGGADVAEAGTSSSKRSSQEAQRYS